MNEIIQKVNQQRIEELEDMIANALAILDEWFKDNPAINLSSNDGTYPTDYYYKDTTDKMLTELRKCLANDKTNAGEPTK